MIQLFAVIFFLFSFSNAFAEYSAGITIDSSSNMLVQPGSESGTYARLYGALGRSVLEKGYVSYNTEVAFFEHYNGLQLHNHELSANYSLISGKSFSWAAKASGNLARFGDVTVLRGFNSYDLISTMKYNIKPTLPLRWGISIEKKDFIKYDPENYKEAETFLRLDKYFKTRTTLRMQLNYGVRDLSNVRKDTLSRILDVKLLLAQSLTDITGASIELRSSSLFTGSSPSDSSRIFNRVFLDDKYKYSLKGISFSLTRLFPGKGSVKLVGIFNDRKYNKGTLTFFDNLPQNGWTEKEKGVTLILVYNLGFVPDFIQPSCRFYYIDVKASESFLSYNVAGISIDFSFQ